MSEGVKKIKVSVIVPVYNTEKYIGQCIDSVLRQSLRELEVICVDDGSQDKTKEILMKKAEQDCRLRVLHQEHLGAGQARNYGMQEAKGEYLYFLDADDFVEDDLLKSVVERLDATRAEICLFGARKYVQSTNEFVPMNYVFKIPLRTPEDGIFGRDDLDRRFWMTTGVPWNKVFRRSFIQKEGIEFMRLERSNDVYFVYMALALAEHVTYVNQVLITHRVGMSTNLQAQNDRTPLCFYKAQEALRKGLTDRGIYEDAKIGFINRALKSTVYNLMSLRTKEGFSAVYRKIRSEGADLFEFFDVPTELRWSKQDYDILGDILELEIDEFIEKYGNKIKIRKNV